MALFKTHSRAVKPKLMVLNRAIPIVIIFIIYA